MGQMLFNFRTENEDKLATVFLVSGLVNEDGGQFTKASGIFSQGW